MARIKERLRAMEKAHDWKPDAPPKKPVEAVPAQFGAFEEHLITKTNILLRRTRR